MEAGTTRQSSGATSGLGSIARAISQLGEFGLFSARALAALPGVWRFASEVLRQAGILIAGSTLIIAALGVVIGVECGLFGIYFLRPAGASDFVGLVTGMCSGRAAPQLMFGYIFAAKVGCGLVAEIGSMRINEELDAFESAGIDSLRFVVATRIAAAFLFMPFIYVIVAAATSLGAFAFVVGLGEVSQGGFEATHWALQSVSDYAFSFLQLFAVGTAIVLVSTYYGFHVRGGSVEVGTATSRSMVANLVLIHVITGAMTSVFFGPDQGLPIGG